MYKNMNIFMIILAVLNLCAAIVEFKKGHIAMGGVFVCYSVATMLLCIVARSK